MNREILVFEIQELARVIFNSPDLIVTNELCATDVDSWTSLSFMHLLTAIEEKFGFRFRMIELLQLRNMGAIIDITMKHIA